MSLVLIVAGAILGYYIARWRGHRSWIGVVVGGIVPFGIILLAVIPPKRKQVEE